MDNPNFPLIVIDLGNGTAKKVLDSQLDEAVAKATGRIVIYRVSHNATFVSRGGKVSIRSAVCKGPYRYDGATLTNA